MLGKALYEGILLDLPLAGFFLKKFRTSHCDVRLESEVHTRIHTRTHTYRHAHINRLSANPALLSQLQPNGLLKNYGIPAHCPFSLPDCWLSRLTRDLIDITRLSLNSGKLLYRSLNQLFNQSMNEKSYEFS